ncbi:medium-chain acyl-CoA ligase ACSF2, mitochondrial-like [Seriola aureovittata]|uniref:medium-chain acyl-CoA ligase ACSF2, mitochondrial-like n=1 Tax=Seriola aureovittata TaxID=2871759 RepID=UPI0024BE1F84|nr:medium-chain acyl-CoA ligase ACSF2, mitochondrial-like [Seriola aureovittata]XP_056257505.1 medium-chain acyl-CoA ligase ACSF2, mitochondrial-like [Seriola aureovittata]XP_056257507.1 medium-chain acyl-CoA ligase ACSF2, mitochondrial-like [Seriola aureovittata]
MSGLISSSLLRCCAHSLRSVDGLKHSKTWKSCNTSVLHWCRARSLHVDSPPHKPSLTTSYVHGTSTFPLIPLTVGQSLDNTVQRWPDREAVVFLHDGIRKTFAQFQQDVDKVAAGLLALGLKRGDRLGVWGPNIYEWILFQFASAKAGIILVSLNPAYQVKEVEFTLNKVQCKAVVCPTHFKTQKFCEMLREICPEIDLTPAGTVKSSRVPDLRMVIVTDSRQPGMLHVEDVMQAGESRHHKELMDLQSKLSFDDPINIQFTSGTTGSPKGATLSHHNIVNNAYFMGLRMGYTSIPQVRVCVPVPMYHCFGSVLGGMSMAMHGIKLVFPSPGYSSLANLEAIQSEKCNIVYGTPTMFTDLLSQPELHKYDLSSIEAGIMAGSPCPPEIVRKLRTDLNMKEITLAYGTTENSPITFLGFPQDNEELKINTVGCIMSHTEAKVVDPSTGEIVPLGASGELMIRGSCVMHGYWADPEKTGEVISQDRWYRTGDTASLNSLGYCRIEGRIKDMIIRGGENIYPAEIEQFLYTHPKVQEVQVVGVKDERLGEQVCACIRLKEGHISSTEEIRAFCKGQISHFKIPHYVIFVDSYPLTVSGKIKKNILKQDMEKKLGL